MGRSAPDERDRRTIAARLDGAQPADDEERVEVPAPDGLRVHRHAARAHDRAAVFRARNDAVGRGLHLATRHVECRERPRQVEDVEVRKHEEAQRHHGGDVRK